MEKLIDKSIKCVSAYGTNIIMSVGQKGRRVARTKIYCFEYLSNDYHNYSEIAGDTTN